MKFRYITISLMIAITTMGILTNCSDDDSSGGRPMVNYIRITDPDASDSLIVAASQGQMIAIMGQNLQHTEQVWFNDQPSSLTTTFITNTSVITRVPTELPDVITNKMKLVFANGDSLLYDFSVDVSKPLISRLKSEYVNAGEVATFYGDYFYEPLVVTFSGGVEAEIIAVEDQELQVVVPEGAEPGTITIASNFGVTETEFWFADNRNVIADFEGPFANGFWRGGDFVVESDPDVNNVNEKFMRVNKGQQGAWPYLELYGGPADGDVALLTRVIPQGAFDDPENYNLKFEINTQETLSGAVMRLYLGSAGGGEFGDARNNIYYQWQANLNTEGEWQTVTIPWADVYEANQEFDYNPAGYGMYIYFHGPNAAIYNFAMDNFRVVPSTSN